MTSVNVEEIYQQHIKPLPAAERIRLIEMTARDLVVQPTEEGFSERHDWMSVRGIAPDLLEGEDAQEWVSRTRREADEHREKQWQQKP